MSDTNVISGIVKILENPRQTLINKIIPVIEFRVQFPQTNNNQIIDLIFWGKLGKDVIDYYKINDYIIIEGYLSIQNNELFQKPQRIKITVLKIYPLLLSSADIVNN
jgi:hypothetical protein